MISFSCPACGKTLEVKGEVAGKKVKCPHCDQALTAPAYGESLTGALTDHGPRPQPAPDGDRTRYEPIEEEKVTPRPSSDILGQPTQGPGGQAGLTAFLAPPQAAGEIGRLGPYRVLQVLGHGGMGVVFKAEDPGLLRLVALKAMLPSMAAAPNARERFLREARAAAALKHPHIVTIYQVSEDRGAPFLAMEFLEGEPLAERMRREGKLPVKEVVRIGREVALGLACAHDKGLVHRDIKPANVWLEGKAANAKILDFGLARVLADDTHLTQSGAIIGTPAFMAPEQADAQKVDHRADLFSLGSMLYRMCTGELPFKGNTTMAILSALALVTPPDPARVNAEVPAELSELIMSLLAKKPEDRPASAQEVAAALAEAAGEQTTVLPRPKTLTRKAEAAPRKPALPEPGKGGRWWPAAAVAAVVLVGLAAGVWWAVNPGGGPAGQPSGPAGPNPGGPEQPASAWEPGPDTDMLPGLAGRPARIDGLRRWQIETVAPRTTPTRVAWSPDGLLAVGTASGEIRLYDGELRPLRFLYGHEGEIKALSWTRGGRLASGSDDKTIRIWEADGTPGPVMRDADAVLAVAWRPDGTLLASGGNNGLVRLWQPAGTPERTLQGHTKPVHFLSWSADGRRLASVGDDAIRLWDGDGKAGPVLQFQGEGYSAVAWSPDGARLASSGLVGVRLWDVDGKAGPLLPKGHSHTVASVSWSPDGRMLATGSYDGTARLWEGPDFKPGPVLFPARPFSVDLVSSVAWSPDSRRLAACRTGGLPGIEKDGAVQLGGADGKPERQLGQASSIPSVSWSPDGKRLASGGEDRYVRLWSAEGQPGPVLVGHKSPVESVCWSPDGQRLASACGQDPIRLWAADGKEGPVIRGGSAPVFWSPDGQVIASRKAGAPNGWRIWDARTYRQVGTDLPGAGGPWTWSPDSQRAAEAGGHHLALLRRDGTVERSLHPRHVFSASWSPDGRYIALGTNGGTDLLTAAGDPGPWLGGGGNVLAVSWARDSQRLAAGVSDGTLRLWGVDRKAGPVLRSPGTSVLSVSWAREGNRLATTRSDGTLRVHETGALQPLWTAVVPRSGRVAVFSAAGQMLSGFPATADEDFVYVAQTDAGRFELYTPTEFRKKALKDGKPLPLFAPDAAPPSRPVAEAWIQQVRQKPPAQQRDEVLACLRDRNPGYLDPFESREANGQVVSITLPPSAALRDLSPLRALAGLKQLAINGPADGFRLPLSDLKSLAGLRLKELSCTGTNVTDLGPLEGMPLERLTLHNVPVADLKPLRALPLQALTLRDTQVSDLAPLRPIASLKVLDVRGSRVTDLRPVQGLLLESVACDFEPKRDAPVLRAMPTLRRINDKPAAEFWKEVDAKGPDKKP